MTGFAIQLHTFRNVDEPLATTIERIATTPFEGVEFAGLTDANPNRIATVLEETGLDPVGAHVRADLIEEDYDGTVETYRTLGVDRLVVPTYERSAFRSVQGVEEAATRLAGLADRLADDGFELLYHNHLFEFEALDERTAFDRFVEQLDGQVGLEIDTGLVTSGGGDPVELLGRHGSHSPLVHLTDSVPGDDDKLHVDLETGVVDVEGCVGAAIDAGSDWIIFEHGQTDVPFESAEGAAEVLARASARTDAG